jgi:hypothetical protein
MVCVIGFFAVGLSVGSAQDHVPLFDARGVAESGKAVNIANRWVFNQVEVTVYCSAESVGYVVTDNGDGTYGNPLVDNYLTAGDDGVSICIGGIDLPDPIAGDNCFNTAQTVRPLGTPLGDLYTSSATAPVDLAVGENTITFKLWDWGSSYGNTKLVLELPEGCSPAPQSCADLSQFGSVVTIDFEGIATQPGGEFAVELVGDEFPGMTLTPLEGELWVGEPINDTSPNCDSFYGQDFYAVSPDAVLSPDNCYGQASVSPVGSFRVDFDVPLIAVGLYFLDAEAGYSNIEIFDGIGGNSLGQAVAQNQPDDSQVFRYVYDATENIQSAVIELGLAPPDGVAIDDLCFVVPPTCETDLIAGGGGDDGEDVGSVVATDMLDGSWIIAYNTVDPWELTELHLHLACDPADLPQNKSGNPQIGHFYYNAYPEPGTQNFVFPNDVDGLDEVVPLYGDFKNGFIPCTDPGNGFCCECPNIAAHAVVTDTAYCEQFTTFYGPENGSGDLYAVNVSAGIATKIADLGGAYGTGSYPNGAAWDPVNERLYFTDSIGDLHFWSEGSGVTYAGALDGGRIADGAFHDGKYFYIANNTDDVQEVLFDAVSGAVVSQSVICADIAGNIGLGFGDIIIDPDGSTLYVSAGVGGVGRWLVVDLGNACAVTDAQNPDKWFQLAYGNDGVLYGQRTDLDKFFMVDAADGSLFDEFEIVKDTGGIFSSNDLASGTRCVPPTETAWGYGDDFEGRSWAMYFDPCICAQPPTVDE